MFKVVECLCIRYVTTAINSHFHTSFHLFPCFYVINKRSACIEILGGANPRLFNSTKFKVTASPLTQMLKIRTNALM